VALILTVLVLSILVILGFALSYGAGVSAGAARNARAAFVSAAAADAALAYAAALLAEDRASGSQDDLGEGWAREDLTVTVGGEHMALRITDENRKLNVNRAALPPAQAKDPDLRPALKRLVVNVGGSALDYERLCRWIAPGGGGGTGRPLAAIAALACVPDLDKALLTGKNEKPPLSAVLTTVSARVNVNTAEKEVLDALWDDALLTGNILGARRQAPFRDEAQVEAFVARARGETAGEARTALPAGVSSDWFRVEVRPVGGRGGLRALVRRDEGGIRTQSVTRLSEEDAP